MMRNLFKIWGTVSFPITLSHGFSWLLLVSWNCDHLILSGHCRHRLNDILTAQCCNLQSTEPSAFLGVILKVFDAVSEKERNSLFCAPDYSSLAVVWLQKHYKIFKSTISFYETLCLLLERAIAVFVLRELVLRRLIGTQATYEHVNK